MDHSQSFVIRSPEIMGNCVSMISQIPPDGSVTVKIEGTKEKRRLAQNSTLWMWHTDISNHNGMTKDEIHDEFRKTFLTKIYLASPQGRLQDAWCKTYADITELVSDMSPEEATPVINRVKLLVSTVWATVDQFTEYLNVIERFCISKGIPLRHPDEYHQAMGMQHAA